MRARMILSTSATVLLFALSASAQEAAPRIKGHRFPLEPRKQKERPVDPKTYVEAPEAPPKPAAAMDDLPMARKGRSGSDWYSSVQFGWMYASQDSLHTFSGPSQVEVRRVGSRPLSASLRWDLRPPVFPFSLVLGGFFSRGQESLSDVSQTLNRVNFTALELRGQAGLRLHMIPRRWFGGSHDLRLGADIEYASFEMATLYFDPAQDPATLMDIDSRQIISLIPRAEYHYAPKANWSATFGFGYGMPKLHSGSGGVSLESYRRLEGEVQVARYLSPLYALGVKAFLAKEKATWRLPGTTDLIDAAETESLRFTFFLKRDF